MKRVALLLAALCWLGCRSPIPMPPDVGVPLPADDPRPEALLSGLWEQSRARQSMRGTVRVSVDASDWTYRSTQRVAALRPARLRVEILGLFSQTAAVLATDGETYQFFEAGSGRREDGPVRDDLLWQVARVDLEPGDAVALLVGGATPGEDYRVGRADLREDGSIGVRLDDPQGRARQRFVFDVSGRLVAQENWDPRGLASWEARFGDYREIDGIPFADRIDLRFPRTGAEARVKFRGVELNPTLDPALFSLQLPERVSSRPGGRAR